MRTDGVDAPLEYRVALTVAGDEILADYTGTSPQQPRAINCVYAYTYAMTAYALKCALLPGLANNEGMYRPVRVTAPEGSILNPRFPAAVVSRAVTGHYVPVLLFGALHRVIPDRIMAGAGSPLWAGQPRRRPHQRPPHRQPAPARADEGRHGAREDAGRRRLGAARPARARAARARPRPRLRHAREIHVAALHVGRDQLDPHAVADVEPLPAAHQLALHVRLPDPHPRALVGRPGNEGVEGLADPRLHQQRRSRFPHLTLDLVRVVLLLRAVAREGAELVRGVRRRPARESRLEEALREQVGKAAVGRRRVRVVPGAAAAARPRRPPPRVPAVPP